MRTYTNTEDIMGTYTNTEDVMGTYTKVFPKWTVTLQTQIVNAEMVLNFSTFIDILCYLAK